MGVRWTSSPSSHTPCFSEYCYFWLKKNKMAPVKMPNSRLHKRQLTDQRATSRWAASWSALKPRLRMGVSNVAAIAQHNLTMCNKYSPTRCTLVQPCSPHVHSAPHNKSASSSPIRYKIWHCHFIQSLRAAKWHLLYFSRYPVLFVCASRVHMFFLGGQNYLTFW